MTADRQPLRHLTRKTVFGGRDDAFWIDVATLENDFGWTHDHDFAELVFVRSGRGYHVSVFGEAPLRLGHCLMLTPGMWHTYRHCRQLEVINCCFRPEIVARELGAIEHDLALRNLLATSLNPAHAGPLHFSLPRPTVADCERHLMAIRQLQFLGTAAARIQSRAHFLNLLAILSESLDAQTRKLLEGASQVPEVVARVASLIENDLARPWKLQELAARAHLDPFYLVRLFKKHTGEPPLQYQTRRRAEQAASLLATTSLPIAEIGMRVGWDSPTYFARRFKAHFGVSANEFRRSRKARE